MNKVLGALCVLWVAGPASATATERPPSKAFMEVYSNMRLVPLEQDYQGYQISVLHVVRDSGEELRVVWQQGGGPLMVPQLLTPEKRGDAWIVHVDGDGDWTLRVAKTAIEAVSPRGQHELLRRIRSLD
jgi:hypothetical protein